MKRVYVIGDSISLHYGEYFADAIFNTFTYVQRKNVQEALDNINMAVGGNGGDSSRVLNLVKKQAEEGTLDIIDILLFNCGLHDIKRHPPKGELQVEADLYEKNLCEIIEIIKTHGVSPIFLTTTPVNDEIHHSYLEINNGIERFNDDVVNYNKIAVRVMEKYKVPIIDLYSYTLDFGEKAYDDHVHYTSEVRKLQAEFIANELKRIMQ